MSIVLSILGAVLVVLKLLGLVHIGWLAALAPFILALAPALFVMTIIGLKALVE